MRTNAPGAAGRELPAPRRSRPPAPSTARLPLRLGRAAELRDYYRAVGEVQEKMRSVLDALDGDEEAIAELLGMLRRERVQIERAMGTVAALTAHS